MKKNRLNAITAFSLIELSIAMIVIAIAVAGTTSVMIGRASNDGARITNERIQAIYKAMGQYLMLNKKLPCPASLNLARTDSNYGVSRTCSSTDGTLYDPATGLGYWRHATFRNLFYGMVPTKTLGLPIEYSEDGFGTKIDYAVISGFTSSGHFGVSDVNKKDPNNFSANTYGGTLLDKSSGNTNTNTGTNSRITIYQIKKNVDTTTTATLVTSDAAFVIISHGANKAGGWNANGTTQNSDSSSTEEKWNQVLNSSSNATSSTATFFPVNPATPFVISSNNDSVFDDIVFYKTRNELVSDFKMYNLIPCESTPTYSETSTSSVWTWYFEYYNFYYGQINYDATNNVYNHYCANYPSSIKTPGKKCGIGGVWDQGTTGAAIKCM